MTHPADQRRAELVEIVARLMFKQNFGDSYGGPDAPYAPMWCDPNGCGAKAHERHKDKIAWQYFEDEAAEILQALTAAGVDLECWMEIESAPKDGTSIIAYGRWDDQPVEVRWRNNDWMAVWNGYSVIESQGDTWTNYHFADPLSHWRPLLPLPPKDKSNGA